MGILKYAGIALGLGMLASVCHAGRGRTSAVGGVSINADGVLKQMTRDEAGRLRTELQKSLEQAGTDLKESTKTRKVSLRRLALALQELVRDGKEIPDEIRHMAGLQRVNYVFVYPDQQDIVLAGPAEGWKVDEQGFVVGETTGRPVLNIEDFVVAMRTAEQAARAGITCSIDPTQEGMQKLQQYVNGLGGRVGSTPAQKQAILRQIEDQLGLQTITLGGVATNSRFAHVLVGADYQMKRFAMGFDQSPVRGMPSFLQLSSGKGNNMFPRWWLTTNYEPLLKSADGNAWELRGQGVKVMTQDGFFNEQGERTTTDRVNPAAQKWADSMTGKYDELSAKAPIFGELRNAMDLAVITALIFKEGLHTKAGLDVNPLMDAALPLMDLRIPKNVPTQASSLQKGRNFVISASGGVEINSWGVAGNSEPSNELTPVQQKSAADPTSWRWWWN